MIKTYVALDSRVRPLIMTIKHWTKQRSLNDAGKNLYAYHVQLNVTMCFS